MLDVRGAEKGKEVGAACREQDRHAWCGEGKGGRCYLLRARQACAMRGVAGNAAACVRRVGDGVGLVG